jgi:hypothetical protein
VNDPLKNWKKGKEEEKKIRSHSRGVKAVSSYVHNTTHKLSFFTSSEKNVDSMKLKKMNKRRKETFSFIQ